ncbi:YojF family protein [Alicyclobacillus tolerans]|uniref:DUF1806 family protein n=1 Tax=Alicyclobacillus tolerans TaxID=90970 RepID=UPI001F3B4ACF|nr:DUF1806 family protein [Alicyclobacillus tolerans]MCF8564010.1 YojF family protein [Alicyclobacillus tolerans]
MQALDPKRVQIALEHWLGRAVYVHLEVNPGAYWRNGTAVLSAVHVRGGGPHRVFLEFAEPAGLIHIDDVTHMVIEEHLVVCTGFDDRDRLARTLEISDCPFSM